MLEIIQENRGSNARNNTRK